MEPYRQITRPPTDHVVVANGLNVHYLDWGVDRGGSTDVVFLHGAALTAHTWDTVCDLLRDEYRCLALDLRGHGDSAWAPAEGGYDPAEFSADLREAVEQLGLQRFVLIGMSLGGGVALEYAGTHGARLSGLVVVDTGPRDANAPSGVQAQGAGRIRQFVADDRELESFEAFVERALAFNPRRSREQLRNSLRFSLRQTPAGTWTWKSDPRLMERRPQSAARNEQLWAAARNFNSPALVVRGGESELFSDTDAERLAAALPQGRWVRIEGAGHTVQGDRPHALAHELRKFLNGIG